MPELADEWKIVKTTSVQRVAYDSTRVLDTDEGLRVWVRLDQLPESGSGEASVRSSRFDVLLRCQTEEMQTKAFVNLTEGAELQGQTVTPDGYDEWERVGPNSAAEAVLREVCSWGTT